MSDDANDYSLSTMRIADSGDLFVTLSDRVSGAYMAVHESTFVRLRNSWQDLNRALPTSGSCQGNGTFGAVENERHFAVNVDCEDEFLPSLEEAVDPQYATRAVVVDGVKTTALGLGTITDMSGTEAAGYSDGLHHSTSPSVILWSGSRRRKIGDGVGFGVTSDGTVVGDNRRSWDVPGHPMIWNKDRFRVAISSTLRGSAFAIKDGVIVGRIENRGFVAQKETLPQSLRLLKSEDGKVDILTAFAVAKGGRILAVGRDRHGSLLILTLRLRRDSDLAN